MSNTKTKTVVQFKAPRHTLLDTLQKLLVVQVAKYGQLPLDHFHVDVRKMGITVTRNNLDLQLSCKAVARGLVTGKMLLSPQVLPFLKASTAREVTVTLVDRPEKYQDKMVDKDHFVVDVGPYSLSTFHKVHKAVTKTRHHYTVQVTAGSATSTLEGRDMEDFPPVIEAGGKPIRIEGLVKAISEVSYAVARETQRPVLNGINVSLARGRLELAAADGFRLAVSRAKAKGRLAESVIVPLPTATVLEKLFKGPVIMRAEPARPNQVRLITFEGSGYILATKAIEGTYPNYQQLIPEKGRTLRAQVKPLAEAVKMALTSGSAIVRLESGTRGLKVTGKGDTHQVESVVPAKGQARIAFNGKYLLDILNRVDTFDLRTTDQSSPGMVRQNGTCHLLMPMFVEWGEKPKAFNGVSEMKVR